MYSIVFCENFIYLSNNFCNHCAICYPEIKRKGSLISIHDSVDDGDDEIVQKSGKILSEESTSFKS